MSRASLDDSVEIVAKWRKRGQLFPATVLVGLWLWCLIEWGMAKALELSFLLLLGVIWGAWVLLRRLRFGGGRLAYTVGLWRRSVDLGALASISWKWTRGGPPLGSIFVRDRHGRCVRIYVSQRVTPSGPVAVPAFSRSDEWGPLLLDTAARSGATVDAHSRHLLEGRGTAEEDARLFGPSS
jgi:hypothetical protein